MANQQLPWAGKHTGFMLSWLCSLLCTKWFKRQCQPAQVTDLAEKQPVKAGWTAANNKGLTVLHNSNAFLP